MFNTDIGLYWNKCSHQEFIFKDGLHSEIKILKIHLMDKTIVLREYLAILFQKVAF